MKIISKRGRVEEPKVAEVMDFTLDIDLTQQDCQSTPDFGHKTLDQEYEDWLQDGLLPASGFGGSESEIVDR